MGRRKEIHDRVLNAKSPEELMAAYGEWASHYDSDLLGEMGYVAPQIATRQLALYLEDRAALILDAGCGTGIVGEILNGMGYTNLEGLDYSWDMIAKASEKRVYKTITQGDLTRSLDMVDNTYDAVISVGTFTCGHVGPTALYELLRVTKPAGFICITVREAAWQKEHYRSIVDAMVNDGVIAMETVTTADYIQQEGSSCNVCVLRVLDTPHPDISSR